LFLGHNKFGFRFNPSLITQRNQIGFLYDGTKLSQRPQTAKYFGKKVSKNIKTKLIFHQKRANTPVIFDTNETNPDSKRNTICIGLNDPSIKLFYFALAS